MERMEQQVWERVLGQQSEQPRMDIRPLMLDALERAAVYQRLMQERTGKHKEMLRKLYEGELANVACLRGMAVISGTGAGKPTAMPAPKEPAAKALGKCYHRSCRALTEYTARSAEPEFGVVFLRMAKRQEELCAMAVELLGEPAK